jgi:hypothetical protein
MKKLPLYMVILTVLIGIALSGCASEPPAEQMPATNTTAKVFFIMPNSGVTITGGGLAFGTRFRLWDSDKYLSSIGRREYVMFNMNAGRHYIMANGGNWYTVEANLTAGESYYFEIITLPGFGSPNVRIKYLPKGDPDIDKFFKDCKEIAPRDNIAPSMIQKAAEKLKSALANEKIDVVP